MSDPNGPYAGGPEGPPQWGQPGPGPYGSWPGHPIHPYGYNLDHPKGNTVLVLGILGIVLCQLCGPFAWSIGRQTLAEIDAEPGRYGNRGVVQAGYICGIVGTILLALSLLGVVLYIVGIVAVVSLSA